MSRAQRTFTAKGARTRDGIIAAAAALMHEYGVAETSIDDVKAAARVSGSQLYHYFTDKDELVEAVAAHQAEYVVVTQREADLRTPAGVWAWRDAVIAAAGASDGRGGCPLGSLGAQIAEANPAARDRIATGFGEWASILREGLAHLQTSGYLVTNVAPDDLAITVLATIQGGLLLAQITRDTLPLHTALTTVLLMLAGPEGSRINLDPWQSQ